MGKSLCLFNNKKLLFGIIIALNDDDLKTVVSVVVVPCRCELKIYICFNYYFFFFPGRKFVDLIYDWLFYSSKCGLGGSFHFFFFFFFFLKQRTGENFHIRLAVSVRLHTNVGLKFFSPD